MQAIAVDHALETLGALRHLARHTALGAALGALGRVWEIVLEPRDAGGVDRRVARQTWTRFRALVARDLENVRRGYYPRELIDRFPLTAYLAQLPEGLDELWAVTRRRRRSGFDELPPEARAAVYPRYYRRTFHWQCGGWFTERSARLYDVGVEFLFAGTAAMMRRMAIPPLVEIARHRPGALVLDLACGTGSFIGQLAVALPEARLLGIDLSLPYLRHARGGAARPARAGFAQATVERLPFDDGSVTAASCIFLFHELPRDVRRAVLREARRVLEPGGRLVICDAAQLDESPELRPALERFPRFYHEPYFLGYIRDPLRRALEEAGFEVLSEEAHLASKVIVARPR